MSLAIIIAAVVGAYVAGLSAFVMGAGLLASFGVLVATGVSVTLALGLFVALRGAMPRRRRTAREYTTT